MITSHPASHSRQNYDYFSRFPGDLPVIISGMAGSRASPSEAAPNQESVLQRCRCAAGFRRMIPNVIGIEWPNTRNPATCAAGSEVLPFQDWMSSSSMKVSSSSSDAFARLRKSTVSAMISQP